MAAARRPQRSQSGSVAEAQRRLAERTKQAETALNTYLDTIIEIDEHQTTITAATQRQTQALAHLADIVGPAQTAEITGLQPARIRAAINHTKQLATTPKTVAGPSGPTTGPP